MVYKTVIFCTSHHTMFIEVKVNWKIVIGGDKKHSGWSSKKADIDTSLGDFWKKEKSSIQRSIDVPKHRKLVDSLFLFDRPKEDDAHPLDMSKTFKETFKLDDRDNMPKQVELYTDYYGRTGKRKRED